MARVKKTVDYIVELCSNGKESRQSLGKILRRQYMKWTKTLDLKDFLDFNNMILVNKAEIGAAQFFGKFRAYAFEEYVYRLLMEKVHIAMPLKLFWGEKCLVWQGEGKNYAIEFDISIGMKKDEVVDPFVVLEAKVELDSARLKTALASFTMLERLKPNVECILVYVVKDVNETFLQLAKKWSVKIFQLSLERNETDIFLNHVSKCLSDYM